MVALAPVSANGSYVSSALRLLLTIIIVLFAFEWVFALVCAHLLHLEYPFTTPYAFPPFHFSDFTDYLPRAASIGQSHFLLRMGPGLGLPFAYPLSCLYLYRLFVPFTHPVAAYLFVSITIFVTVALLFTRHLRAIGAGPLFQISPSIVLFFGFPAPFLLERGNIEVFLWLFLVAGLAAFVRNWSYLAAVCFACAACMKIYPAIFFLLFLPRRQYKAILLGVAVAATLFVTAIAAAGPSFSATMQDVSTISKMLHDGQIVRTAEPNLRWDHSLFGEEKQLVYTFDRFTHRIPKDGDPLFPGSLRVYTLLVPLAFLALYLLRLRRMPLLNQFAVLTICSVLLPFVSYEYTLVHMFLVFAIFLVFLHQDITFGSVALPRSTLRLTMIGFALVFGTITATSLEHFPGQVKGIALLCLLIAFTRHPMPSTLFADRLKSPSQAVAA